MLTPCIRVCKIEDDKCTGCGRTIEEIRYWTILSDEQREQIMKKLEYNKTRTSKAERLRRYDRG